MMQVDDPAFLTVGTEVSAKYKGAFCEAKVNKVVKNVKVKITYKQGIGSTVLSDDSIKGILKLGAQVKAFNCDCGQYLDGTINKIQDCSQYTVVFDDGDITTLRRNSLCLKSGRHFAESETLDQLPLTHPEHFSTPVVGGRRGRRSRQNNDSDNGSSDEDNIYKRHRCEWANDTGKVVCVEIGDKKKQKDNWFPGLVVAPTAQDTVKIETKKDYLVRSFQDGRYYTVPKKEALKFTKDTGSKVSNSGLKAAVEKALQYINHNELPTHWDREALFGFDLSEDGDSTKESDTSDDEPREEKDHFVAQLYKYMEECGTPINKGPSIGKKDLDLYKIFKIVQKLGGYNRVMNQNLWKAVANKMGLLSLGTQAPTLTKAAYKRYLHSFEDFYRKLGCTMISSPKSSKVRHRSGRNLIRDCDRAPRVKKRNADRDESPEELIKKEEPPKKVEKVVERKEIEKVKEEIRSSRNRTPPAFASRMSPCRDKLRTPRITVKTEVRVVSVKKEVAKEVKTIKKEESASEEEFETGRIRQSLRNREDPKDKEERGKNLRKGPCRDQHQRSVSCNSNSSGTSSSSVSVQGPDAVKASEKKLKVTRSITVCNPEELKKRVINIPTPEEQKKRVLTLPTHEEPKKKGLTLPTQEEQKRKSLILPTHEEPKKRGLTLPTHEEPKRKSIVLPTPEEPKKKVSPSPIPEELKKKSLSLPTPEDLKKKSLTLNTPEELKKKSLIVPSTDEMKKRRLMLSTPEELKKRGRRRKLSEDSLNSLKKTMLPPGISVNVGDKLLVLYGPNRDEKITYEAKVLKVNENEKKQYYVHYLGWNIRYDEWVERSRVAQNQTWRQTRSKKIIKPDFNKDKKDCKLEQVTSLSPRPPCLKRNRSGSFVNKEDRHGEKSDSSASSCHASMSQQSLSSSDVKRNCKKRLLRTALGSTENTDSEDFDSDAESELNSQLTSSGSSQEEKTTELVVDPKTESQYETSEEIPASSTGCGKDIDLKAIESEMKGLDKAVKKEVIVCIKEPPCRTVNVIQGSLTFTEKKANPVKKAISVKLVPAHELMGQIKSLTISEIKKEPLMMEDDIYEFKEPEPFEIGEIRSRKELKAKCQDESDSDGSKAGKSEENLDFSPKKVLKVDGKDADISIDLIEPVLKVETNKELKDYTRRVESKDHTKPLECKKDKVKADESEVSLSTDGNTSPIYEVLNQGRQSDIYSNSTNLEWITEQGIPFELDSAGQKLSCAESDKSKVDCYGVDIKIDPVPIKSSEPDFVTPLQIEISKKACDLIETSSSKDNTKTTLSSLAKCKLITEQMHAKIHKGSSHVLPAKVFMPHSDSRMTSKLPKLDSSYHSSNQVKVEERTEAKLLPFSQRQQHIFPHLLNRADNIDDKHVKQRSPTAVLQQSPSSPSASEDSHSTVTPVAQLIEIQSPTGVESTPTTSHLRSSGIEGKTGHKASNSDNEKVKCEASSIEETIEAVVHKARQDQMHAEEEAKVECKLLEKRRRNPGRLKKMIAREYHADTSEESENECRYEVLQQGGQAKRMKTGEICKYSPTKRVQRMSSETEKQFSQKCHEEDQANDADEEDNESTMPVRNPLSDSIKRKVENSLNDNEDDDKLVRSPKKKRRATLKKEDTDENSANLLCEETFIPGSPMTQEVLIEGQVRPNDKPEMPFASVPTGSSFDKRVVQSQQSSYIHCALSAPATNTVQCKEKTNQAELSETATSSRNKETARSSEKSANGRGDENARRRRNPSDEIINIGGYDRDLLLRAVNQINDRIAVVENTPPTTPDSLLSTSSESPQRENESSKAYDTGKSGQSSEMEFDNKMCSLSEDSNTMDSSKSYSRKHFSTISPLNDLQSEDWDTEDGSSSNNQQKNDTKRLSQEGSIKDMQGTSSACLKTKKFHDSHSFSNDDMDHGLAALSLAACASGRSRYNFCQELDPSLEPSKRISVLQNRIQECRKIYLKVKNELAVIEKRKKKIRKKIREKDTSEEPS